MHVDRLERSPDDADHELGVLIDRQGSQKANHVADTVGTTAALKRMRGDRAATG